MKQMNFSIPDEWYKELQRHAFERSLEEGRSYTVQDIVAQAVRERYGLKGQRTSRKHTS